MNNATIASDIPPGFRPIPMGGAFMMHNGPFYGKLEGNRLLFGFRVQERHCNPMKNCHGGMLASFADMLMPCAALYQETVPERRFMPTISLQVDYLSPAPLGAWVQGEADVLRSTRNMLFAHGLVRADGVMAMRVSGVFKQGPVIGSGDTDPYGLRA